MGTDWDDDPDEIVVDDQPREDGLTSEEPSVGQANETTLVEDAEVTTDPNEEVLERLESLNQLHLQSQHAMHANQVAVLEELGNRFDYLLDRLDGLQDQIELLEARMSSQPAAETVADSTTEEEADSQVSATDAVFTSASDSDDDQSVETPSDGDSSFSLIQQLVFDQPLLESKAIESQRDALIAGIAQRDRTAIGLAARMIQAQSAGADELPPLLKEIGEAFYRWYPKSEDTTDEFEDALIAFLDRCVAAVGLRNSIQLVRPGDRYDAKRHLSSDRGVEVASVHGWVVLRENGKPLTKAMVALQ